MEIFNTKYEAKRGNSSDNYIGTSLVNNRRLLPTEDFTTVIDEVETYNEERENSDKIRLIVTINPICTNVLFNRITEVVYKEGSTDCKCLNAFSSSDNIGDTITSMAYDKKTLGKSMSDFNRKSDAFGSVTLTRDTQLSRFDDVEYKCGIDIFNNHILRSQSFKSVCKQNGDNNKDFNTLFDTMREWDGTVVSGYATDSNNRKDLHLYLAEDVLPYDESVDTNLIEDNGWLGFTNTGKILTYNDGEPMQINRVINNMPSCGFVDMCPSRDLWYFTPKYNKYQNRFEKNWNYCLTYPSASTTDVSFIDKQTKGLKVYYFDDEMSAGSMNLCKIVSFCKHGLQLNDVVNLYFNKSDGESVVKSNLFVARVYDEYSFAVRFSPQDWITEKNFVTWQTKNEFDNKINTKGLYSWNSRDKRIVNKVGTDISYVVFNSDGKYKTNLDDTFTNVTFRQVINGEEAEYYVRIFSKLPNFKFAEEDLSNLTDSLIKKYSKKEYDFDSTIGKAAFAKNSYGDDVSQIVFTDDIKLNGLVDNLGRPLTEIYLTIIKNNAGYRKWYGKSGTDIELTSKDIEYSHVFGKNSCAFELCPLTAGNINHQSIFQNNNLNKAYYAQGLNMEVLSNNPGKRSFLDSDEIEYNIVTNSDGTKTYEGDTDFYGDLCLYVPSILAEMTIDDVWFRFNTAQRELTNQDKSYKILNYLTYDEILSDDYDSSGFRSKTESVPNATRASEGYKYKPHYKIPIKSFSKELMTATPHIVGVKSIDKLEDGKFAIVTEQESYVEKNNDFVIFNQLRNKYYNCTVINIDTPTKFYFIMAEKDKDNPLFYDNVLVYSVIKKQETIPSSAVLLKDGSMQYAWREVYQNGFDSNSTNEIYPFTNGALYIEKSIRFFCKRQDPDGYLKAMSTTTDEVINDIEPNIPDIISEDRYVDSDDINCFN